MPKTIRGVIVHHPNGLHKGVADFGADKGEASMLQCFAHGI